MRRTKDRWAPVTGRNYGQAAVAIVTLTAIAAFALALRPSHENRAVVRVSLDRIPEERVVEFGHEMPRITMVSPTGAELPPGEMILPSASTAPAATDSVPPGPAMATAIPRQPAARRAERPALVADAHGILPIDFRLPEGVSSHDGGVGVAKTLASEGGAATGLTIFLIGGSMIEVDRAELLAALAQLGAADKAGRIPPAGDSGRLSLDKVRTAGLDLRYDAIQDRLVLRP